MRTLEKLLDIFDEPKSGPDYGQDKLESILIIFDFGRSCPDFSVHTSKETYSRYLYLNFCIIYYIPYVTYDMLYIEKYRAYK